MTDKNGQTLVEIIVVLGIVLLLVTGLIAGTSSATRTSDQNRDKSLAVTYAQEGIELTRRLRDAGWSAFQARNGTYCLNKSGAWSSPPCSVNIDAIYTRSITFSWNGPASRMEVTSTVSWQDSSITRQTQLVTYFTQWQ